MLISLIRSGMILEQIPAILVSILVVLLSLSFHEMSHALASLALGDRTAKNLGRVSMNPIRHLDPIGTICMLLCGFGWAKPVPVNARNFKNPKYGMAITSLAGPFSNLVLAFFGLICYRICISLFHIQVSSEILTIVLDLIVAFFYYLHIMNLQLALFNLLPVPPLDGSRIMFIILPSKYYFSVMKYERIISFIILALLWTGLLATPLTLLSGLISNGMNSLINLIVGVF